MARQNITVLFGQGVDEKTSDLVVQGKLLEATNVVFKKDGALSPRNGYDRLKPQKLNHNALPTTIPSGQALATFQSQLLLASSSSLYSRSSLDSTGKLASWELVGDAFASSVQTSVLLQNEREQRNTSVARLHGVQLTAYEDTTTQTLRARVESSQLGTVFQNDVEISDAGIEPSCLVIGDFLFVVYREGQSLKFVRLDPYDPQGFDLSGYLVAGQLRSWNPFWRICSFGSNAVLWYMNDYVRFSSNYSAFLGYVTPNGTIGNVGDGLAAPQTVFMEATEGGADLNVYGTNRIVIAYWSNSPDDSGNGALLARAFDESLLQTVTSSTAVGIDYNNAELSGALKSIAAAWTSTKSFQVGYTVQSGSSSELAYVKCGGLDDVIQISITQSLDVVTTGSVLIRSVALIASAFEQNGHAHFPVSHDSDVQSQNFFVRDDRKLVASSLPFNKSIGHLSASVSMTGTLLPRVQSQGDGTFVVPVGIRGELQAASGSQYTLKGVAVTDLQLNGIIMSRELANETLFAGALPAGYDGTRTTEHGFLLYPEMSASDISGSALTQGANYSWTSIYRWTDAKGQIHRSKPAPAMRIASSSGSAQLSVSTLRATNKEDVSIELYRTLSNRTIFHKVKTTDNDKTVDAVSFTDDVPDSVAESNEFLYTTPGDPNAVLPTYAPGPFSVMCTHQDRYFYSGLELDPYVVAYSQTRVEGEGIEFNPKLTFKVDSRYGRVTALESMDDKLVVFTEEAVFFVEGAGPNDAGNDSGYSIPFSIASDVGCVDSRTVVKTPNGLMFKSSKGIKLVNRGLEIVDIGARVEDHNDETIVASTVVPAQNQARFLTDAGNVLCYDYRLDQWTTFDRHSDPMDATVWRDSYCWLRSDGSVMKQSSGYLDDGAPIWTTIVTDNVPVVPGTFIGEGTIISAHFKGKFKGAHVWSIEAAPDGTDDWELQGFFETDGALNLDTFGSDDTFGGADVFGGDSDTDETFSVPWIGFRCSSVKFRLKMVGSRTEGCELAVIQLFVESGKNGGRRVVTAKQVGG